MSESRAPAVSGTDVRCHCGKLIARWQGDSLVIKCTRCGRLVQIRSSAIGGTPPPEFTSGPRR
ncbi:MAG: Com family DNA-binding transcriptional regulator [Nitrospira sp. CR1.3]|nr:Com family DNA-binding transcriptional regulator [Nitrospira sp. CR1.3]